MVFMLASCFSVNLINFRLCYRECETLLAILNPALDLIYPSFNSIVHSAIFDLIPEGIFLCTVADDVGRRDEFI